MRTQQRVTLIGKSNLNARLAQTLVLSIHENLNYFESLHKALSPVNSATTKKKKNKIKKTILREERNEKRKHILQ